PLPVPAAPPIAAVVPGARQMPLEVVRADVVDPPLRRPDRVVREDPAPHGPGLPAPAPRAGRPGPCGAGSSRTTRSGRRSGGSTTSARTTSSGICRAPGTTAAIGGAAGTGSG